MIKAPRGTNDVLPPESSKWAKLEALLRHLAKTHNFSEIKTPMFEHTELFSRSVGESSDIVQKEMYTFQDKGGRDITLRPEGTAAVVRAFLEHGLASGPLPQKLFYLGSMFRYEKPQAGRYREHIQFGAEVLGSRSAYSDVEVMLLGVKIAEELGLTGTTLFINTIGCPVCRKKYTQDLIAHLSQRSSDLCLDCQSRLNRNPLRVLDCKKSACKEITFDAPSMHDYLCSDCKTHWDDLKRILSALNFEYTVDPSLVRGLDYYTNTVFELKWPPLGAQSTIIGGGRYDGLVEALGGKALPGAGFAMGLERLLLAAEEGEKPITADVDVDCFVTAVDSRDSDVSREIASQSFKLVKSLRAVDVSCDFDPLRRSTKAQMKHANRLNAKYVVILGEEEIKKATASVRSMEKGWQKEIDISLVPGLLKEELLDGSN